MKQVLVNSKQVSGHGETVLEGKMGMWGSLLSPLDRGKEVGGRRLLVAYEPSLFPFSMETEC